jgi:hypothetical protein
MAKDMTHAAEAKLLRKAVALAHDHKKNSIDKNWIDLSLCLAERAALPGRKGTEQDFVAEFVRQSGLSQKSYYRFLKIGRGLRDLPVDQRMRDRLAKIGPTKCEKICENITASNANELLKLAEENSARKLEALIREESGQEQERCMLLYFSLEQRQIVEQALLSHGAKRDPKTHGLSNKEAAILQLIRKAAPRKKKSD